MGYGNNEWDKGLCGCLASPKNCCCAACCFPCSIGSVYEKMGYESCWPGCCGMTPFALRNMVRKHAHITGDCTNDYLMTCCCCYCAVCQMLNQADTFPQQEHM
eukprot:GHVR01020619.1.p1 GENE.GHVR01020619.1~~GHVR01020619.1.p1  ORF type:complete len:116 (+),score=17.14 GHVR01020619.1:42-350(+)